MTNIYSVDGSVSARVALGSLATANSEIALVTLRAGSVALIDAFDLQGAISRSRKRNPSIQDLATKMQSTAALCVVGAAIEDLVPADWSRITAALGKSEARGVVFGLSSAKPRFVSRASASLRAVVHSGAPRPASIAGVLSGRMYRCDQGEKPVYCIGTGADAPTCPKDPRHGKMVPV